MTLTRELDPPRDPADVREDVMALTAWRPVATDADLLERAWEVEDDYGYSWWDALIVAAALRSGARYLLTEALQAGQDIGPLTILDPFESAPADVLG